MGLVMRQRAQQLTGQLFFAWRGQRRRPQRTRDVLERPRRLGPLTTMRELADEVVTPFDRLFGIGGARPQFVHERPDQRIGFANLLSERVHHGRSAEVPHAVGRFEHRFLLDKPVVQGTLIAGHERAGLRVAVEPVVVPTRPAALVVTLNRPVHDAAQHVATGRFVVRSHLHLFEDKTLQILESLVE